ncbi:phosphatase PAP2 family protein [Streptomyces sp. SID3212]|uniref:phosphatase PAP2 family protein n=1 Tax=Streptomyces sp. SID3212 TaxID=2690259 RepID=UPI001368CC4D|nr:phosphatase PAP2 family protein [Streptomyces sp. SID3212]
MSGPRPGTAVLVCASATLFAALAALVSVRHGTPLPGDGATHAWSVRHRPHLAVSLARGITATGTGPWPYLIAAAAGLPAGRTTPERLRAGALALTVLLAGQAARYGLLALIARPRPPLADWATHASGYSFPSGHTTTSALAGGLLSWGITRHIARASADPGAASPDGGPPLRGAHGRLLRTVRLLPLVWAAAVALTRIYLGVHWASDVIGGWLYAAACLTGATLLVRARPSRPGF